MTYQKPLKSFAMIALWTLTCLSRSAIAGFAPLDSFLCYETKPKGFEEIDGVRVVDRWNDLIYDLTESRELCAPAANSCGCQGDCPVPQIGDAATHLKRYKVEHEGDVAEFLPQSVSVTTCLGTVTVDTDEDDKLMVPAAKDLSSAPSAPDSMSHGVDHFHCYDAELSSGHLPKGLQITLTDQFTGNPKKFDVKDIEHLCVAADKNGEGVKDRAAALLCYKVKAAKKQPKFSKIKKVWSTDQFGPQRQDITAEDEACLPATIGLEPCEAPGAPGWQNVVRPGGNGVITQDPTPQDCCASCLADQSCAQWAFTSGICSHNVGSVCVGNETPFVDGGHVRCPGD